ncbi:MFS transporter [Pararhodospirillum photometricum]|uniref:Permease of the major facilitator superfamily n=1 Tax=Pararhodospirillum photometricum DSM 122 TaxID=1150469 RepID=H6SLX6_PARPM|nr:MFS transporter [Pararhodospirillum photometricum]CCG08991.1 Permease of the major facilitator superfamily [Pararhodospirillum photometricum DSM 122]
MPEHVPPPPPAASLGVESPRPGLVSNPVVRLFAATTVVLVLTMILTGLYAFGVSQRHLLPELDFNARAVGDAIAERVAVAQEVGIPFERLVGMDEYLGSVLATQSEIAYLGMTDPTGKVLYRAGLEASEIHRILTASPSDESGSQTAEDGWAFWLSRASLLVSGPPLRRDAPRAGYYDTILPLLFQGQPVGVLHIGVSVDFYKEEISEEAGDVLIAVVIALLVAFEILIAVTTLTLSGPLDTLLATLRQAAQGILVRPVQGSVREIDRLAHHMGGVVDALNTALTGLKARVEALRARWPERQAQAALHDIDQGLDTALRPADPAQTPVDLASVFIGARVCAFLFVLAEEIARPFMPVFIQATAQESGLGGNALLIGLPMSLFLLVVALTMPWAAGWSERLGRRRTFVLGAGVSTVGLLGTALDPTFGALLAWRALSGLGYALTFVACQGHVLDHAGPAQRARGVAVFVGGITAADICGPAIGGMLAARIGFEAVLGVGAGLALGAAVFGMWALRGPSVVLPSPGAGVGSMLSLLKNKRLVVVLLLSAVPAKVVLSGALFFLVPLVAADLGATQAEIGRLVMLYGLAGFVLAQPFARQADRWSLHGLAVGMGGMVAGLGLLPLLFDVSMLTVSGAVLALGVGQALSISPQLAFVLKVAEDDLARVGQAPVVGLYRLVERLGGASGPFIASALIAPCGLGGAMAALGAGVAVAAVLFCVVFLVVGAAPHPDDRPDDPADVLPQGNGRREAVR